MKTFTPLQRKYMKNNIVNKSVNCGYIRGVTCIAGIYIDTVSFLYFSIYYLQNKYIYIIILYLTP